MKWGALFLIVTLLAFPSLAGESELDPHGLPKSTIFRVMANTDSFTCTGFVLRWKGETFGATAGHCNRGGFLVKVYYWLYVINTFYRTVSEGPGRDISLFRTNYLTYYFKVWEVGEAKIGDQVFVDGFSGKGRRATNCRVEDVSREPNAFYKIMQCSMPLYFGESGAPVIKDGKVVGIVTHLFANDFSRVVFTSFPEAFELFGR